MLYDSEFILRLPDPYKGWKAPLVAYIAKGVTEKHSSLRKFIESFYTNIPEEQKPIYYSRLRSEDDKVFIAQMNEFLVANFCSSLGEIDFNSMLDNGQTPELLWHINDQTALLDVVTLFDSEVIGKEEEAIDRLLNYLSDIEHYFDIGVWYQSFYRSELKLRSIKGKLLEHLNGLDPTNVDPDEELIIEAEGFLLGFLISPKGNFNKSKINFALLGPVRGGEPLKAIEKRIKSKLQKYKWEGPIFVAICKAAGFGADWEDVAEILYGPTVIIYNRNTGDHDEVLGKGGLIMPRGLNPSHNTSLTAILYCEQNWNGNPSTLKVKSLINPYAKYRVDLPIPSYPIIENGRIRFQWVNTTEDLGHH